MARLKNPITYRGYVTGFILSLIFTMAAYLVVQQHVASEHSSFPHQILIPIMIVLALAQLTAQLVYFLHLGKESKPRWNMMVFLFAVLVVGIVVFGSLWIIQNLNYHHEHDSSRDTDSFIIKDEGIKPHSH